MWIVHLLIIIWKRTYHHCLTLNYRTRTKLYLHTKISVWNWLHVFIMWIIAPLKWGKFWINSNYLWISMRHCSHRTHEKNSWLSYFPYSTCCYVLSLLSLLCIQLSTSTRHRDWCTNNMYKLCFLSNRKNCE